MTRLSGFGCKSHTMHVISWLQDEADLAAALFFELRNVLLEAHRQKKEGLKATRVGVITPYRQQRKCLQDTFNALCGEFAKEVCCPFFVLIRLFSFYIGFLLFECS